MDLGLSGRVALVTGASKGIGRAIAAELAAEGARVAVSARSRERLAEVSGELGVHAFEHDNADIEAIDQLVAEVESALGPIEILITNTGGPPPSPAPLNHTVEEWEAAYRTLVLAPMMLVAAVMPGMQERRFGRIVNVASSTVREPSATLMLSNSHRSATLAAFKTIARDVAPDGVTVNSVLPGRIATDRLFELFGSKEVAESIGAAEIPAERLGTPEEFAAAVAFLCSERAGYITGAALLVDGGLTQSI
ncbi:MAG: 3-oxoacyl-[acyl-carrier protein] reductase [Solirubrobacteraceae bacterium]|jgi:3-oxoacyl-[acyl-carrier protein] reductase|nr:3-oxoacyl-[acyl-carrier protein] reductase [Solirubrobacteraceae bacterium]